MEGYLLKWTNYVFGWQRRYFTLSKGILQYSKQKGSPQKGIIHLDISQVLQHAKNKRRFYVDTGLTLMHLKADTEAEALRWFETLLANKDISISYSQNNEIINVISEKIGELCSFHAQILAEADLLPINFIKTTPGLERAIALCEEMKELASEALGIIETQEDFANPPLSPDYLPQHPKLDSEFDFYQEDSGTFVDARSQISDIDDSSPVLSLPRRKFLPFLRDPKQKINIWKVIRESIGLELSKIAVPVYFNEPLSFLQRFSEDLSYNSLLLKASECEDSTLRLAYIASFIVSSYASSDCRTMKPFNPLLGETFDLERDGFRLITEQVSHHPPVSALHCEHEEYCFSASTEVKTNFKGTYLRVHPVGKNHLILKRSGDHYMWDKPFTNVHNIIIGKIYVEHYGVVEVVNSATGDTAVVDFKKQGWFDKSFNDITGVVRDCNGVERYLLAGKWNQGVKIVNCGTKEEIQAWELHPFPENYEFSYFFSDYALQLNLPPESFPGLCRTDSRFRPDQRQLELGDVKAATAEKHRGGRRKKAMKNMYLGGLSMKIRIGGTRAGTGRPRITGTLEVTLIFTRHRQ